jgi:hypothetical protein
MCNGTWVCYTCRTAVRRPTWRLSTHLHPESFGTQGNGSVRCPKCREACSYLGPTIEIPPKRNVLKWKALRENIFRLGTAAVDVQFKNSVRRRHAFEQWIRELESRPSDAKRNELIKELRSSLRKF